MKKSWTFVENLGIVWEKEADMAHAFPPVTSRIDSRSRFGVTEFEPLLNSEQAADLLQIHHKTLQKLARHLCRLAGFPVPGGPHLDESVDVKVDPQFSILRPKDNW